MRTFKVINHSTGNNIHLNYESCDAVVDAVKNLYPNDCCTIRIVSELVPNDSFKSTTINLFGQAKGCAK